MGNATQWWVVLFGGQSIRVEAASANEAEEIATSWGVSVWYVKGEA